MRFLALLALGTLAAVPQASGDASGANNGATLLRLRGGGFLSAITEKCASMLPSSPQVAAGPKVIISGAPASGKGTQCEFIVSRFGVVHISTGDALREQVKAGTQLGKQVKGYMAKGELVPDDLIIDIVKDRLAKSDCVRKGWLLDGFPRTGVQAEAMRKAGINAGTVFAAPR
jgi:adenylate kinase